jgi:cytochrome c5
MRRGLPKVGANPPVALQAGDTRKLIEKSCGTGCHSIEVVTSQRMNRAEWTTIVQNMIARGAPATDAESKAIVDYLASQLTR